MRKGKKIPYLFLAPSLLSFFLFLIIPVVMMIVISFTTNDGYGGIEYKLSFKAYTQVFSSLYGGIFLRSVWWAFLVTMISLLVGYPFAYFLAHTKKWRNVLLFLVIIPFWTNLLVRTYAWIILLKNDGIINSALMALGLIEGPIPMLYTPFAIMIGLIYGFLPFMILPIYTSIDKLDRAYLDAAIDLGATAVQTFRKVTLPLTMPGIIAGSFLTFIPALGIFVVPDILGGSRVIMIGNVIRDDFQVNMNWQLGASVSITMTAVVILFISLFMRFSKKNSLI